jgi:hypothetical protein
MGSDVNRARSGADDATEELVDEPADLLLLKMPTDYKYV